MPPRRGITVVRLYAITISLAFLLGQNITASSLPATPKTSRRSDANNQVKFSGARKDDPNHWVLTVPNDGYDLCIATRLINDTGLAPIRSSKPLTAGDHDIRLKQSREGEFWIITVTEKSTPLLSVTETVDWFHRPGMLDGYSTNFGLQPHDKTGPGVFYRHRITRQITPDNKIHDPGPYDGILLWLEQTDRLAVKP